MYWIIKDWKLCYSVEELPVKTQYYTEKEMKKMESAILQDETLSEDEKQEKIKTLSNVKVEGIDYDEAIEYSFDWPPEYINGEIVVSPLFLKQKREEKKNEIICSNDLENVSIEWFDFSDIEIGEIITARVFGGNPYAQQALQAKLIAMLTSGTQDKELIAKSEYVKSEINKVRELFNLSAI